MIKTMYRISDVTPVKYSFKTDSERLKLAQKYHYDVYDVLGTQSYWFNKDSKIVVKQKIITMSYLHSVLKVLSEQNSAMKKKDICKLVEPLCCTKSDSNGIIFSEIVANGYIKPVGRGAQTKYEITNLGKKCFKNAKNNYSELEEEIMSKLKKQRNMN